MILERGTITIIIIIIIITIIIIIIIIRFNTNKKTSFSSIYDNMCANLHNFWW